MIQIVCPAVHSFSLEFLDVTWQIADTTESPSDYFIRVARSESPEGPFEVITKPPLEGVFSFRDEKVDLLSKWRVWYYQIAASHKTDTSVPTTYSEVAHLGFKPDLVAMEMARLHQITLQTQIGVPCVILPRRTSGPSCPFCYDSIRKRSKDSDCLVCLGTSEYRGGFLDPIGTWINQSPSQKVLRSMNVQTQSKSDKSFDMSGYPVLRSGWVIVDPENRRYRVVEVRNRSKRGFIHRQVVQVSEIPRSDSVYKLSVTADMFPGEESPLWPRPAHFGQIALPVRDKNVKGRWADDFV